MNLVTPYCPKFLPPKIALVGEASGKQEEILGRPFVGDAGEELTRMLYDAGIIREDCYITNLLLFRPEDNDIKTLCADKKTVDEEFGGKYPYKPFAPGKYLRPEFCRNRDRLYEELRTINPTVTIALGNSATWALLDETGINKIRGTVHTSRYVPGKIIPTFHPASVLRQWDQRVICVADMIKARRESHYPEIRSPEVEIWLRPSIADMWKFKELYLDTAKHICPDIETAPSRRQITCVGFGTGTHSIVIPFCSKSSAEYSYWPSVEEEIKAWEFIQAVLASPVPKTFQNGMYDIQWLADLGLSIAGMENDTMLLHHSQQPEMDKDLGFLGSIYTDFPNWKHLRTRSDYSNNDK